MPTPLEIPDDGTDFLSQKGGGPGGPPPSFTGGGGNPDPGGLLEILLRASSAFGDSPFGGGGRRRRRMGVAGMEYPPIPAYREGGTHPGGLAMVGEDGPEMVDLPAGASVTPNAHTILLQLIMALMAGDQQLMGDEGGGDVPHYALGTPNRRAGWGTVPGVPQTPREANGGGGLPPGVMERSGLGDRSDVELASLYGPDGKFNLNAFLQALTGHGVSAGLFDPLGSKETAGMIRDRISATSGGRERAASLGADLDSGGDPSLGAYGRLMARLNTQSDSSNAYSGALLDTANRNQDFLHGLYGGQMGAVLRKDPKEPNPWAQIGGQVGGAVVGAATGGLAGGAGAAAPARPAPPRNPGIGYLDDSRRMPWGGY